MSAATPDTPRMDYRDRLRARRAAAYAAPSVLDVPLLAMTPGVEIGPFTDLSRLIAERTARA